ncbi:methyltransferase domain-containing protein [Rutstroemia sp. NJR-2017a WRK4]|nr:methyltransferase domain-containing protein [Rutstroemia sp. NJR-2017a WRK4]
MAAPAKPSEDHWSSEAYQNSASFVPKLATKVLGWLDVQPDDVILDIGCGDGILNLQIAQTLSRGNGRIHGIDSSSSMIAAAQALVAKTGDAKIAEICTFQVLDAAKLDSLPKGAYNKIFSNAAMHLTQTKWILRPPSLRIPFFNTISTLLSPGGTFVFEMGGHNNISSVHSALLSVVSRHIPGGVPAARALDPWFFPSEQWMQRTLSQVPGLEVEKLETEYRPTKADAGGIEGWVRLMGKQFLDGVGEEGSKEREEVVREVVEVLGTICGEEGGGVEGEWLGYVRLRGMVKKIK